jgi:hypothetical protein
MRLQREGRTHRPSRSRGPGAAAGGGGVPPTFRSLTVVNASAAGTVTPTRPAGSVSGDLLILVFASNVTAVTTPTGWTLVSSAVGRGYTEAAEVYVRESDGTATDLPVIDQIPLTYGGVALFAFENASYDSAALCNLSTLATAIDAPALSPIASGLVLSLRVARGGTAATSITGGDTLHNSASTPNFVMAAATRAGVAGVPAATVSFTGGGALARFYHTIGIA